MLKSVVVPDCTVKVIVVVPVVPEHGDNVIPFDEQELNSQSPLAVMVNVSVPPLKGNVNDDFDTDIVVAQSLPGVTPQAGWFTVMYFIVPSSK